MADNKVKISEKPTSPVEKPDVSRGKGNSVNFTVSFTLPKQATNEKSKKRWEAIDLTWIITVKIVGNPQKKKYKDIAQGIATYFPQSVHNYHSLLEPDIDSSKNTIKLKFHRTVGVSAAKRSFALPLGQIYPHASSYHDVVYEVLKVECKIRGTNKYGFGKEMVPGYVFYAPNKPTVQMGYDVDNSIYTFSSNSPYDDLANHRYSQTVEIYRQDNLPGSGFNQTKLAYSNHTTDQSHSHPITISQAKGLKKDQWIRYYGRSIAYGARGDSGWTAVGGGVEKMIAWPSDAEIKSVSIPDVTDPTGEIAFTIDVHRTYYRPTEAVYLERLSSTKISNQTEAAYAEGWEQIALSRDNGYSIGLTDVLVNARPDLETHVWYRLRTVHDNYELVSKPIGSIKSGDGADAELAKLERVVPTGEDDKCEVTSLISGADGESARVIVGYANSSLDDSDGTEISWSDNEDSWDSTEQPSAFDITKDDTEVDPTALEKGWARSAHIIIRGLSENTPYFVKARRYKNMDDGDVSFGDYSMPWKVIPVTTPKNVMLYGPSYVVRGEGAHFYWTYDSAASQKEWHFFANNGEWSLDENNEWQYTPVAKSAIKFGTDSLGACDLEWADIEKFYSEDLRNVDDSGKFSIQNIPESSDTVFPIGSKLQIEDEKTISFDNSLIDYYNDNKRMCKLFFEASVIFWPRNNESTVLRLKNDPDFSGPLTEIVNLSEPGHDWPGIIVKGLSDETINRWNDSGNDYYISLWMKEKDVDDPTYYWDDYQDAEGVHNSPFEYEVGATDNWIYFTYKDPIDPSSERKAWEYFNGQQVEDNYKYGNTLCFGCIITIVLNNKNYRDDSTSRYGYQKSPLCINYDLTESYDDVNILTLSDAESLNAWESHFTQNTITVSKSSTEKSIITLKKSSDIMDFDPNDSQYRDDYYRYTRGNLYYKEERLRFIGYSFNIDLKKLPNPQFYVKMKTGGDFATSKPVQILLVDRPKTDISTSAVLQEDGSYVLTEGPLKITFYSDNKDLDAVIAIKTMRTNYGGYPGQPIVQTEGETVYAAYCKASSAPETGTVPISWVDNEDLTKEFSYQADLDVQLPRVILDSSDYTITAYTIDTKYNTKSDEVTQTFSVQLVHQAEAPSYSSKIFGDPKSKQATIYPIAPETAIDNDTCYIYRNTPDGVYEIARDVPFGSTVVDRYAPFGKEVTLSYILATVTADGDVNYIEIPYNVYSSVLRFDWDGTYVELPWNVKNSDSFEKSVEQNDYMNGDVGMNWNDIYHRSANLSTDLIKLDTAQHVLVKQLAQYSGPVFVRTPNGCAYQADVQVNSIDYEYNNPISPVTLTAKEMTLSDEFKVADSDITSPTTP